MSDGALLEVDDLRYSYGARVAVASVSLTCRRGEVLGILGPNGAGKTTLISCIAGLLDRFGGNMRMLGEPFTPATADHHRRRIGLVPQDLALNGELTGRENLTFFAQVLGVPPAEADGRVDDALDFAGLRERADDRYGARPMRHASWASRLTLALLAVLSACSDTRDRLQVAFVTNNTGPFWTIARSGAEAAAKEFDCAVSVLMPPTGKTDEQKRILEDLLARGVKGIAVSPIDPDNQTGFLDQVAARTLLITHDSDAPRSKRRCFVGVDNYSAGRLCGELVREALPDGGSVVLLVGNLDADNARRRRQGLIDALLDRAPDPTRFDSQDAVLNNEKYQVLATFTDQTDRQKGKAAAQDALTRWPDLGCMVGLYEYEPPLILEAVKSAGRLGKVKIVGFDENAATLQGIADGHLHGTVVQDPWRYGYESVRLLAAMARAADDTARAALVPPGGHIDVPARQLRGADIAAFRTEVQQRLGK